MIRIYLTSLLLLIIFNSGIAQTYSVSGRVVEDHEKPLSYVNIYSKFDIGTYSDEKGKFKFNIPDSIQYIVFSSLGFKNDTVFFQNKILKDTSIFVVLHRSDYRLSEILVVEKKIKSIGLNKKTGFLKERENHILRLNKGHILAYFCENEQQIPGKVKYVKIRFSKIRNKPKIRIKFYTTLVDNEGNVQPGKLVNQSDIISLKRRDEKYKYIPKETFFFHETGMFIGVELVDGGDFVSKSSSYSLNYPTFMLTTRAEKPLTWKSFMDASWHQIRLMDVEKQRYKNMKVELSVDY